MSDEINVLYSPQSIIVEPALRSVSVIHQIGPPGPQGPAGIDGADGYPGQSVSTSNLVFQSLQSAASSPASNNGASTFTPVNDPNYRFTTYAAFNRCYMQGRIGGSLVAATKIRIQYVLTSDPNIATGSGSWATLMESAGSHTLNTSFLTADMNVPALAGGAHCLLRCGIYGGDGVADPTISLCVLTFFNS